jgi:hypothetical protein
MENYKSLSEREPTPYPMKNNIKNVSELGPLNSIIVPPLKKAVELLNSEINNKKSPPAPVEAPPAPVEAPPAPVEAPPAPVEAPPAPVESPKNSIIPSLIEAEQLSKERELFPFQRPTPFEQAIENDSVRPHNEIIIEEYIIKKPKMPLLEEESMVNSMELVPIVRRSRKSKSPSSPSPGKKTRKYKRCSKNHRRSKKTHRCNKNCPPGHKKSAVSRRCVKKGGKK